MSDFMYRDGIEMVNRHRQIRERERIAQDYIDYVERKKANRREEFYNFIFTVGMGTAIGLLVGLAIVM